LVRKPNLGRIPSKKNDSYSKTYEIFTINFESESLIYKPNQKYSINIFFIVIQSYKNRS